jgi:acetylornithine deacetylase/succinyl-diaminopimelate desuccinylase-like protein
MEKRKEFILTARKKHVIMLRSCVLRAFVTAALFSMTGAQAADSTSTAKLLSELIRVDSSNPPGREGRIAELLASKFRPLGFKVDIVPTPEPGKAHFLARLKGDGSKGPVLLAAHADVVGVEREKWTVDPFAGTIREGYVYGRGAIDFKGGLAVFAEAVMRLARNHVPLHRDVILLSEADEEGGRYSTRWLAETHWNLIRCESALNEGGWIIKDQNEKIRYVSISTADKLSVSLLLTASGTSTHSSMPRPDSPIYALARALSKLADYDAPIQLIPSTRDFFLTLARTSEPPLSTYFNNLVNSADPAMVQKADREISKDPLLHAIMRNTIAPVFLKAGFRGNVIPGSAQATINMRVIPGTDPQALISQIRGIINDPRVELTLIPANTPDGARMAENLRLAANLKPSAKETPLYRALERSARSLWPGVPVTAYLFQAGTDALPWRSRGVPVYGIYPYPITSEDLTRMHGNDERVPVRSLEQGTELIYRTLVEVASK